MMKRKIHASRRGITFTAQSAEIGRRYRYFIDVSGKTVYIVPDENGTITASRKRSGAVLKPLFDLRSKEIRELIADASYMEVIEGEKNIKIRVYKSHKVIAIKQQGIVCLNDILGVAEGELSFSYDASMSTGTYGTDWVVGENTIPKESMNHVYDVVSLFSGAGLFDKAWKDSGRFRFVYANDFCKDVIATYEYNIGRHIVCKDIREVSANELPFADLFLASPCCQAFSNANRHNLHTPEAAKKRLLVEEVVRLVNEKKPKVVVIENVPRMITAENGRYIASVRNGLPEYEVSVQVVTDNEVGGFSIRKRCIVIASRIGKIELPSVRMVTSRTVRDALKGVDSSWYNYEDVTFPNERTIEKMSYVPQGGNWEDIPESIGGYGKNTQSNIMRRLSWDEPSITLSNFRKSNILHPEENRILNVSEAAAIMGLDKSFRFISSSLSAKQQMVSNGVTQAISRFIMRYVLKKLDAYCFG